MTTIKCEKASAPLNISKDKIHGPCTLLCDYNHNYGIYSPSVTNKSNYLSLNYTNPTSKPPVIYNDLEYSVSEVRIYQPSLHKYDGKHAAGEIIIIQGGNGKNLITSIPIAKGTKNDNGSKQLTELILEASQRIPNKGESMTFSGGNFSLDNFIPKRVPYFAYSETLPYEPCNGTYAYVVYGKNNALNISPRVHDKLKKMIKATKVKSDIEKNYLFFNKNGANSRKNNNQIYIDCQPVNEEGEVLVNESTGEVVDSDEENDINWEKIKPFLIILLALIIGIGITKVATIILKKFKKPTNTN